MGWMLLQYKQNHYKNGHAHVYVWAGQYKKYQFRLEMWNVTHPEEDWDDYNTSRDTLQNEENKEDQLHCKGYHTNYLQVGKYVDGYE